MPHVNRDMQKQNVQTVHFTPVGDRKKQTEWRGDENNCASVVDPYFEPQRELGRLDPQRLLPSQIGRVVNNVLYALPHEANLLSNEANFLAQNAQSLRDHMDARLSAMFRQLVDVWGQPYSIESGKVEDQLESSGRMNWVCDDGRRGSLAFQSAHYGTLPCIVAYPRDAYVLWANNPLLPKPAGHVLNKYSDTYHAGNACAGHLQIVNEADSLMDYKSGQDNIVRPFALSLLNASAAKQTDPLSAIRLFIGKLRVTVETLIATRREPSLQTIFQTYREHLAYIHAQIEQDPHSFFKLLLGVEINDNDPLAQKLRTIIYPHRFVALQAMSGYQSQIAARINVLKTQILGGRRRPANFDKAFKAYTITLANQHSEKMGKIFQRYFCTNTANATQAWNECSLRNGNSIAQTKCLTGTAGLQALFSDIDKLMHNYSIDISLLRANLLRQLRQLNNWSQSVVSYKVNQIDPTQRLYHQQLSRMELGQKKISETLADMFTQIFGVHRSVFIADAPYT